MLCQWDRVNEYEQSHIRRERARIRDTQGFGKFCTQSWSSSWGSCYWLCCSSWQYLRVWRWVSKMPTSLGNRIWLSRVKGQLWLKLTSAKLCPLTSLYPLHSTDAVQGRSDVGKLFLCCYWLLLGSGCKSYVWVISTAKAFVRYA